MNSKEKELIEWTEKKLNEIGKDLQVFVNRYSEYWPMVIMCMRTTADTMESSLGPTGKIMLEFLQDSFANSVAITSINETELYKQLEEQE